ncbi:MAG: hypothetical protein GXY83_01550 [Rhodopirellula sp.]|nr:hypothetical protein [Rhodopirellula sp.]
MLVAVSGTAARGAGDDCVLRVGGVGPDGFFLFDNLPAGTYQIVETQPSHYVDGIETVGSAGGTAEANKITDIELAAGNKTTIDYGDDVAELIAFERVRRDSQSGGNDTAEEQAIDFVLVLEGDWDWPWKPSGSMTPARYSR